MSAEAIRYIWEHADATGSELLFLLAIAQHSKWRRPPFTAKVGIRRLADLCRVSRQQALNIREKLLGRRQLDIMQEARGVLPTQWDLLPLVVKPALPLEVKPTIPVQQVQAIDDNPSRADLHCEETPKVPAILFKILPSPTTYPKPKRKRRAAG